MQSTAVKSVILSAALALTAGSVSAQDSPWQFRLRGIGVVPDESATITPINGDVDLTTAYVPEFDITYFMNDNVAFELILATAKHEGTAVGTDAGDVDLGSVWLLPPTLTIQYHLAPEGSFRPYIGAGANLTFFYNVEVPGTVVTDADYETAFGFALQGGVDIPFGDGGWFFNADVKKILLSTDVALNAAAINAEVDINPWVIGAGFGVRLGR